MSSVGVFRKVEMDEKPYLVFTLTQTDNPSSSSEAPAMYSGGDDFPLPPSFFCPRTRLRFQNLRLMEDDDVECWGDIICNMLDFPVDDSFVNKEFILFNSSPHFGSTRRGGESLLDCDDRYFCKLPVLPIFWCNNKEPVFGDLLCGVCDMKRLSVSYYACLQCKSIFHKECVESPLEIKHPYHPFHSLQLLTHTRTTLCTSCGKVIWGMSYDCTTCRLSLHPVCAMRPVPFVLDHPKSHPHPLTLFPTQDSLVCHVCSLVQKFDPTYICIQCVFVVHKDCLGFPHVIRISRHHHRISFTSSIPLEKLSCGVCRHQVDNKYSAYSCNKCDAYFVHSKCALRPKVWDGKELEGVPEEDDTIDDGEPFKRIADGIILHPFHSHHLRLEISITYDQNKYCRGCSLPIYEGQFYSCMKCDFILHESCANAPRMIRHPLNPQPLKLCNMGIINNILIECSACRRVTAGFHYAYDSTEFGSIRLDLRCASIIEPFKYQDHKHPLFLPWDPEELARCQLCKIESNDFKLICLECDYTICFSCATLPYKVRYKHDSHFLMICDGKETGDQPDWCEICEGKIDEVEVRNRWEDGAKERRFYKCNDCCTTLHVECLLGVDIYFNSGYTTTDFAVTVKQEGTRKSAQILLNSSLTRPICYKCNRRCPFPIYLKKPHGDLCSWRCVSVRFGN